VTKSFISEEVKNVDLKESEVEDSPRDVFYDAESEEDI
jgi:hypothetical protein